MDFSKTSGFTNKRKLEFTDEPHIESYIRITDPSGDGIKVPSKQNTKTKYAEPNVNGSARCVIASRPWTDGWEHEYCPGNILFSFIDTKLYRDPMAASVPVINYLLLQQQLKILKNNHLTLSDENNTALIDFTDGEAVIRAFCSKWSIYGCLYSKDTNIGNRRLNAYFNCTVQKQAFVHNIWGRFVNPGDRLYLTLKMYKYESNSIMKAPDGRNETYGGRRIDDKEYYQLVPEINTTPAPNTLSIYVGMVHSTKPGTEASATTVNMDINAMMLNHRVVNSAPLISIFFRV
jgi:hypothetical protein